MSGLSALAGRVTRSIPSSVALSPDEWQRRHRWIVGLVWVHVVVVLVFGAVRGNSPQHVITEGTPVALLGYFASMQWLGRRWRAMAAGLGLMTSSAVLVHLSGGLTVIHFHFFVMLGVISLYQDWLPFLVAIGFVAVHHGVMGVLRPHDVFDNPAAWRSPFKWALIHAFFVLCASAVSVVSWRIVEDDHRRSRLQLEARERRFRSLIEHSSDIVTVIDGTGNIVYDSPSSERVLGYASTEREGRSAFEFIHPDDVAMSIDVLGALVRDGGTVSGLEMRVRHHDGSYRWVEASVSNLLDDPDVAGIVANFRDTTDRKALGDQLRHQAFHDPLTGLANRALLLNRIEHALDTATRQPGFQLALLYVDLDDFKTVNDGLGHEAGDQILRETAVRLQSCIRAGDTPSRLGGDEFAILLEHLPNEALAYEVGERILEALRAPFEIDGASVAINASIGIVLGDEVDGAGSLLRNADLAMYRAKSQGKGRYQVYEDDMHAAVLERIAMKAEMRRGIEAGEFQPHYQPIVDLQSGQVTGVEALVRWHHPTRGLVVPAAFIPLAEETGLIVPIGSHMLRQACADLASWRDELGSDAPESVSVNLSVRQIHDPGLVDDVVHALAAAGLPSSSLILEITESILLQDTDSVGATLRTLRDLGVRFALDDFGTGYSSLSYLERFPVDIVKIDRSFINAMDADASAPDPPLVSAIVNLGKMMGLSVTAEGIEEVGQLDRLRRIGCEHGQGFYFARPVCEDELRQQLRAAFAVL